ncbi:MAG: hypothetical protein M3P89_04870, partial [Actinomycetota bacterium]|nr:hypothetical protein [Actinomycetota bacterium]
MGERRLGVLVEEAAGSDEVPGHPVCVPRVESTQGASDRLVQLARVDPLGQLGARWKRRTTVLRRTDGCTPVMSAFGRPAAARAGTSAIGPLLRTAVLPLRSISCGCAALCTVLPTAACVPGAAARGPTLGRSLAGRTA